MDERMSGYEYRDGMEDQELAQGAYWERNMLALLFADGWYYDRDNNWEGWKRVLSLKDGKVCFHIPDAFNVGNLPEIMPNWDGHSTQDKWNRIAWKFGMKLDWTVNIDD